MLTHRSVCPPAVYRHPWHEAEGEGVMCHGRKCKSADESEIKGGEHLNLFGEAHRHLPFQLRDVGIHSHSVESSPDIKRGHKQRKRKWVDEILQTHTCNNLKYNTFFTLKVKLKVTALKVTQQINTDHDYQATISWYQEINQSVPTWNRFI